MSAHMQTCNQTKVEKYRVDFKHGTWHPERTAGLYPDPDPRRGSHPGSEVATLLN